MAVKTLTFKFIKKTKFKFDKNNFVNKSGKKKVLGLQGMNFTAGEFAYHIAPVKISKNELIVEKKDKDVEEKTDVAAPIAKPEVKKRRRRRGED